MLQITVGERISQNFDFKFEVELMQLPQNCCTSRSAYRLNEVHLEVNSK